MSEFEKEGGLLDQEAAPMNLSVPAQPLQQPSPGLSTSPSSVSSKISISSSPTSLPGFQIHSPLNLTAFGIHLPNGTVALSVPGTAGQPLSNQQAQVVPQNIQVARAGIPLVNSGLGSGPIAFHPRVNPHPAFPQAIPVAGGMQLTLQRLPSKGQPIAVQRFPSGTMVSLPNQQLVNVQKSTRPANSPVRHNLTSSKQILTLNPAQKISTTVAVNMPSQSIHRMTSPTGQHTQRAVTPLNSHQGAVTQASFILPNGTLVSQSATPISTSNGHLQTNQNSGGNLRASSPMGTASLVGSQINTATIIAGQHISIQPRPSLATFITGTPTPITFTVTSISPSPNLLHTTASSNSQQISSLITGQQLLRPVTGISQSQALRAGFQVVLPRSLPGQHHISKGASLPRIAQKPFVTVGNNTVPSTSLIKGHLMVNQPSLKDGEPTVALSCQSAPTSSVVTASVNTASTSVTLSVISPISTESVSSQSDFNNEELLKTSMVTLSESSPGNSDIMNTILEISKPEVENQNNTVSIDSDHLVTDSTDSIIIAVQSEGNQSEITTQSGGASTMAESNKQTPGSSNETELMNVVTETTNDKTETTIDTSAIKIHSESTESSSKDNQGVILTEGFIDSNLLEWTDGVGSLPGTDMKFKINEFGDLELVDDGATLKMEINSCDSLATKDSENNTVANGNNHEETKVSSVADPAELSEHEGDPVCCCVYCGRYGYKSNFKTSGRFCSQSCVGKKNIHRKQLLMSKMMLGMKAKKKKLLLAGEMKTVAKKEGDQAVINDSDKKLQTFDWDQYLAETSSVGAPKRLFREPFPTNRNGFRLGMRLEGVDPKHQSLFCVLSVAEIQGYRIRLHFDGYSECYDFWANADSPFIFPVGWAEKNGKTLQPPKNTSPDDFNWTNYLKQTRAVAASKSLFVNQPNTVTPSAFRVGMKLEAVDKKNSSLVCVASVADTMGERILIHFDGWEDAYDYWCDVTSPSIHPVGWCKANGHSLSAPPDYGDGGNFSWETYMSDTKSTAVPSRAFKTRGPMGFEKGMKLEVVDKRNSILIRVATIVDVQDYRLLIHFDGWDSIYDYWLDDDSLDLHPIHWCAKTFHPLQSPIDKTVKNNVEAGGCPTPGCKGVGHIKGAKYTGHHSAFGCPYSELNMSKDTALTDRLGSSRSEEGAGVLLRHDPNNEFKKCPTLGCDGLGHVTGKFTSHHCLSGCPLAEKNLIKGKQETVVAEPRPIGRPGRGRKRKIHLNSHSSPEEKVIKTEPLEVDEEKSSLQSCIHESVFQSSAMTLPTNDQPLYWEHHAKLLPGILEVNQSQVSSWSVDEVANFILKLTGKEEQAQKFKDEQVDGDSFLLLQQNDLLNFLNIKLGPAIKIFNSILVFKAASET